MNAIDVKYLKKSFSDFQAIKYVTLLFLQSLPALTGASE